jgi:hypothetical protein
LNAQRKKTQERELAGSFFCFYDYFYYYFLRILVRLAGIEPTTPWFVAKYSIQLSYSRESKYFSSFILFPEELTGPFPKQDSLAWCSDAPPLRALRAGPEDLPSEEAAL